MKNLQIAWWTMASKNKTMSIDQATTTFEQIIKFHSKSNLKFELDSKFSYFKSRQWLAASYNTDNIANSFFIVFIYKTVDLMIEYQSLKLEIYKIFNDQTYKSIKHFQFMSEEMLWEKNHFAHNLVNSQQLKKLWIKYCFYPKLINESMKSADHSLDHHNG